MHNVLTMVGAGLSEMKENEVQKKQIADPWRD